MPIFKIDVTEVRHVRCTYWVETKSPNAFETVYHKAEQGDTVHEQQGKMEIHEREVTGEPDLDNQTPFDRIMERARELRLECEDLEPLVDAILSKRATFVNNSGKYAQIRLLLEELGEHEAIGALKNLA